MIHSNDGNYQQNYGFNGVHMVSTIKLCQTQSASKLYLIISNSTNTLSFDLI